MSKKSKKRTKRYRGEDAKTQQVTSTSEPVIHRYEAVQRSKVSEWWQPRKKLFRLGAIVTGVVGGGAILLAELVRIIF